ncbi:hypothetical protein KY342_02150 [Candidatus Woesearchaeota archaeon]|nr:hypothetical protein [Candidatus Woesearchaeota archaeon]
MIAIILGIIMGIFHYFSDILCLKCKPYQNYLISFSAGISITYIFLHLLPQFTYGITQISNFLFLSILIGFVIFHIVEKYIYQHSPEDKLLRELAVEDSITSFIYHFVIGIILVSFVNQGLSEGILFFIPVFLFTAVSTLPVDMTKFKSIKAILAVSTLLGIIFATFIYPNMNQIIYFALLGFIIGALLFTVTRHSIPKKRQGKPFYFIIGVIIYSVLIYLL